MAQSTHPELRALQNELRAIFDAMANFGAARLATKPPILDSSIDVSGSSTDEFHSHQDAVHGLRALRDAVRRDLDVLDKFLHHPQNDSGPSLSTNAPYLIAVWNEVLHAPPPIVTIWHTFPEGSQPISIPRRGSRKPPGVKIDVVADGGKRWIRVNTTKNSRLLAEFREIDSYVTDSEDEFSDDDARPSLAQKEFDNSILRMGRSLLDAAQRNPLASTGEVPYITLRLTRLDPSSPDPKEQDPRIGHTIQLLREMGIDVELGERDTSAAPHITAGPPRRLEPTIRINLDLSILIALVSDITHSSLPSSPADADARYIPSEQYREWKRKRLEASRRTDEDIDESKLWQNGIGKHSRALANQALQEMARGLLHELRDRLAAISPSLQGVEFWTTPEARDRCLRIVLSKIGGPNEKRRASALFLSPGTSPLEAEAAYWQNSRYPPGFLPLVPTRVYDGSIPPADMSPPDQTEKGRTLSPFFTLLARTCRDILAQDAVPPSNSMPAVFPSVPPAPASEQRAGAIELKDAAGGDDEIERAAVTKANPRLTAHTVQSMLWGAARGWTTLTANKSSVKAILRDIRAAEGGYGWVRESQIGAGGAGEVGAAMAETAALWVVDPRSLAEGMRSDFREPDPDSPVPGAE
ncbi:hypothetical protein BD413DRAFT_473545 [Trametes elegans]|nr:hypothetical protein BD413DRAFT_473545 [Trametes elegans]